MRSYQPKLKNGCGRRTKFMLVVYGLLTMLERFAQSRIGRLRAALGRLKQHIPTYSRPGYDVLPLPAPSRLNRIREKCPSGAIGRCSTTRTPP